MGGIFVLEGSNSPGLVVGSTDLSDHVRSITVSMTAEDIDLTAMGAVARQHAPGLRDDSITVEFFQDYAGSKVDATLNALVGSATGATVTAYSSGTTASGTAPKYSGVFCLFDYQPINGEVGAAAMTPVVFRPAQGSYITRGTS